MQAMGAPALVALVVLALAAPTPAALEVKVTPVQKVLEMLGEMKVKGQKALAQEQLVHKGYAEWVDDQKTDLANEIKTHESDIEGLTSSIEKGTNDVSMLKAAVEALEGEVDGLTADLKTAAALREKENADYLLVQADYSESLDAIEQAIQVLKSTPVSVPQAELLLQKMVTTVPGMRRVLAAFLQVGAGSSRGDGAPDVEAYTSNTGMVIEVLEGLRVKFKSELDAVETEESNAAHAHDLEALHIKNTVADMGSDVEEKTSTKAKILSEVGAAEGKLADTQALLKADKKTLADIMSTFGIKTATYNENQAVRKDEIEQLSKAIEIISDPAVAESYAKHINFAQRPTSLLQMQRVRVRTTGMDRASAYLRRRATALSSKALAELATQIKANPFAKVIEMVKSLLAKLKEEAASEADHKSWCDAELRKNKLKREKKTSEVEKLRAEIAVLGEQIEVMGKKIETLIAEQAALTKATVEATEMRTTEKAQNEATIADAKAAQEALKQALTVLKEFYSAQGGSLLQARQVPEMEAYKGMQGMKDGVVGLLEVILSDFARLDAETTADERQAAAEYATFMADSAADKLAKHKAEVQLKLDKDQAEFEKGEMAEDLELVAEDLARAQDYFASLKPSCLEVHVSYEERVKNREEQIAALNEAYEILDGHTMG